jgi:hypothetical protein
MGLLANRKDREQPSMAPVPTAPRRRVSDGAAHFAQNIIDLENRCDQLAAQAATWEHQCSIMGVENKSLREALRETDARLQYFERRAVQLETKLSTAVKIVIDCLDDGGPGQANGAGKKTDAAEECNIKLPAQSETAAASVS